MVFHIINFIWGWLRQSGTNFRVARSITEKDSPHLHLTAPQGVTRRCRLFGLPQKIFAPDTNTLSGSLTDLFVSVIHPRIHRRFSGISSCTKIYWEDDFFSLIIIFTEFFFRRVKNVTSLVTLRRLCVFSPSCHSYLQWYPWLAPLIFFTASKTTEELWQTRRRNSSEKNITSRTFHYFSNFYLAKLKKKIF